MAEKETRNERVYAGIRAEILTGLRKPGEPLRTAELCKTFECSVGVARESLLRLAERDLVEERPMQGFRVVSLSTADLDDLTEARLEIETLALRYSVRQGDAAWEARLVGAHHLLSVTPRQEEGGAQPYSAAWGKAHGAFHTALIDGCRNRHLLAVALRLRDKGELYRRWSVAAPQPGRDVPAEHRGLLDAVLARDADLAAARLTAHLEATHQVLARGL
ncbi:GntR family transcriptional regulator [Amycolatopsis sp. NPDC051903]|uniref:GntR family transcriptional regulator n=1 Tax=Amycolatopsis sp. NPDC051903 TaxID=3363936 RepID=UPI0037BCA3AD